LRETIRPLIPLISPGWDIVLVARASLVTAAFQDVQSVVELLLRRAGLTSPVDEQSLNVR
jgi:RNase P protein component